MGLKRYDVLDLTPKDYILNLMAYKKRLEHDWDTTRNIMSFIASYSGMGSKDPILPTDIMALSIDKTEEEVFIKTEKQAINFLNKF